MSPRMLRLTFSLAACLCLMAAAPATARGQAARHGTLGNWGNGSGNWGGSSFTVGRSTIYANGMVSNRVGDMTYFNNGLVGRQFGRVTVYTNGLVSVDGDRGRFYSNYSVGVPIRGTPGGMVYGGGTPYPLGPTPFPAPPR
ncbi:MAG: hypothetical protein ACKO4T_05590 [Planctomycetaceae bacterium]